MHNTFVHYFFFFVLVYTFSSAADDSDDYIKVGNLLVSLQRSRLLDGQISFQVKVVKGSKFIYPTQLPDNKTPSHHGKSSAKALAAMALPTVSSAKQAGQLTVKCHMIYKTATNQPEQKPQTTKFFRVHSKRASTTTTSCQNPVFGDHFVSMVKEADTRKLKAIRVSRQQNFSFLSI